MGGTFVEAAVGGAAALVAAPVAAVGGKALAGAAVAGGIGYAAYQNQQNNLDIEKLYESGASASSISNQLGISQGAAEKAIKKLDNKRGNE